jgi:hypothetical protein
MQFEFNNETTKEFKDFIPTDINLIDVKLITADGSEIINAYINDEDKLDYDKDVNDSKVRPSILRVPSISGLPLGSYVPTIFKGKELAIADVRNIIGDFFVNRTKRL